MGQRYQPIFFPSPFKAFLRLCLLVLVLFPASLATKAQQPNYRFEHFNIREGLSQSYIYSIIQDKRGFVWMCTADGLNKYDGYTFTHYKHNPSDPNTISNNYTLSCFEDHSGRLWVGTSGGGLNMFDSLHRRVTRFEQAEGDIYSLGGGIVFCITEDKSGHIWVGTDGGGVNMYDERTRKFKHAGNTPSFQKLEGTNVFSLLTGRDGTIWAGGTYGLYRVDPSTLRCEQVTSTDPVHSLALYKGDEIIAGTENDRFYIVNTKTGAVRTYDLHLLFKNWDRGDKIQSIHTNDSDAFIWMGTLKNGLVKVNLETGVYLNYRHDPTRGYTISNNEVACIYRDRSNIVWIGTALGLNKLDQQHERFELFQYETESGLNYTFNNVYAIYEDRGGHIWIGSREGGLSRFDRSTQKFINYTRNDNVSSIVQDKEGNLWVGNFNAGVYKITNPGSKNLNIVRYAADENGDSETGLASNTISSILIDSKDQIWFSTFENGISILNPGTGKFRHLSPVSRSGPRSSHELNSPSIMSCYEDSYGIIWICTFGGGLNRYDPRTGQFTYYMHNPGDPASISHNNLTSVYEDRQHRLWICTFGGGLNLMDRRTGKFTQFREKDGLPNDVIYGILEDERGNLWMSTNDGISRFNPNTRKFRNYDITDNLQNKEFNQGAYFKGADGMFYFGGISGFNAFMPGKVVDNPYIAPVVVTAFKKFDRTDQVNLPADDTISLSYRENFISFEFVLLNYTNSAKNSYAYKLDGFDEDWIYCGSRRYASYTNLEPGEYLFRVKGANNDGVWNEEGVKVVIIVRPLYWQTAWFKTGVVIGGIFLVVIVVYFILNDIKKKSELNFKNQLTEIQLKALRSQMNPHFIFNSLNSIQQFIANSERKQALVYLSKFAKLIRQILENSSRNYVSVENELRTLELYVEMEKLRFGNRFEYEFHIDPGIDQQNTEIPSLLIQPYIENAILHGLVMKMEGGKLNVTLDKHDGNIVCIIEDNGIGRKKALEIKARKETGYQSMGMSVTKERLVILNARMHNKTSVTIIDLEDEEGNALGTRVEINIPIDNPIEKA